MIFYIIPDKILKLVSSLDYTHIVISHNRCLTKVRHRSLTANWDERPPCERANSTSWFTKIKTGSHLAQVQGGANKGFRNGPFQNSPVHNAPSVPSPRKHSYYYATPVPVPILFILFWYSLDALRSFRVSVPLLLKTLTISKILV